MLYTTNIKRSVFLNHLDPSLNRSFQIPEVEIDKGKWRMA